MNSIGFANSSTCSYAVPARSQSAQFYVVNCLLFLLVDRIINTLVGDRNTK